MPRGIQNVSGVSCHISCALQLLSNCIPPLIALYRQEILPASGDGDLLEELGRVLCALITEEDEQEGISSPLDPTSLYGLLEQKGHFNPQDVGDVSMAVYKLWQILSKSNEEWKAVVDYLVLGGQTRQVICGRKAVANGGDCFGVVRRKYGRVKQMACPFPLPMGETTARKDDDEDVPSIEDILRGLCQASAGTRLEAYDWETQPTDSYTEEFLNHAPSNCCNVGGGGDGSWETTKTVQILQLPRYFFLTLERFSCTAEGERIWNYPRMAIPTVLDVSDGSSFQTCRDRLRLKGGVLHVSEDSIVEEGHYVTLVSHQSTSVAESWTLIDDDTCRSIDSETALRWMSGAKDKGGTAEYCAVLLVYGPEELETRAMDSSSDWSPLVAKMRARLEKEAKETEARTSSVDWSQPELLIGRRLKVRWAKGRFYEGIVENFDPSTGKHRVRYNDGDIREYTLCKKAIEWQ